MSDLLALAREAADGAGSTTVISGIEVSHRCEKGVLSIGIGCTDSLRDLGRSLDCRPRRSFPVWLHAGYAWAAALIFLYVKSLCRECKAKDLRFSGHSFGGAVARILAHFFLRSGYSVSELETYGEPASLAIWSTCMETPRRESRYVCGLDPIPLWAPGYVHGTEPTLLASPNTIPSPLDHRLTAYERALNGIR